MRGTDDGVAYVPMPILEDAENAGLHDVKKVQHKKLVYLDGLRGLACSIVAIWHFHSVFFALELADTPNSNFSNSLWLAFFFNGGHMVSLFFVLSGRVLAEGFYRKAHDSERSRLASFKSAVIRRPVRLFVPMLGLYLIIRSFATIGLVPLTHSRYFNYLGAVFPLTQVNSGKFSGDYFTGVPWTRVVWSAVRQMFTFENMLFGPTWTISIEYRGSLIVYLVSTVSTQHAIFGGAVLTFLTWYLSDTNLRDMGWLSYFLGGLLLCHLSHTGGYHFLFKAKPKSKAPWLLFMVAAVRYLLLGALFACAFIVWYGYNATFLAPPVTPCGDWVRAFYAPHEEHFIQVTSSMCAIVWVDNVDLAQTVLGSRFFAYLGKISFAMYLIHTFLYVQVGTWFLTWWVGNVPVTHEVAHSTGFAIAVWLVTFPLCLVALLLCSAGLTRILDQPAVELGFVLVRAVERGPAEWRQILRDSPRAVADKYRSLRKKHHRLTAILPPSSRRDEDGLYTQSEMTHLHGSSQVNSG